MHMQTHQHRHLCSTLICSQIRVSIIATGLEVITQATRIVRPNDAKAPATPPANAAQTMWQRLKLWL